MNKRLFAIAATLFAVEIIQAGQVTAQPYRMGDILYNNFTRQDDGILRSTYSVASSDISGYGVAFDCVRRKVNIYAPDGMPGSPGVKWRWVGWEGEGSSEHSRMFWKQCKGFY